MYFLPQFNGRLLCPWPVDELCYTSLDNPNPHHLKILGTYLHLENPFGLEGTTVFVSNIG